MKTEFDVVIVGMGPVGAAAAMFLSHEGLKVAVVEKSADVYELPRAVALDGEVIRAFQKLGLGHKLASVVQQVRPGERAGFANSAREWLFGQQLVSFGRNGWAPTSMFDQPELERFIRDELLATTDCQVFLAEEVLEFSQTDESVKVVTDKRSLTADWMIACDGAASPVRKSLGIGWQDLGYDHEWLVIDVTLNEGVELQPETLQICSPDRLATYVGTKDPFRRWEFKLRDGETREQMLDDRLIEDLISPWLSPGQYELRRKAVYQFHAATAEQWRTGRVFLAGDAAHQTPPFLGQGLNAGMRDVINLSWKLGLVHRDMCAPALLDSYEAERLPHAQDLVEWAVALGQLMEHLAETERAVRAGEPEPELPQQKQASGYGQGREAPPLREGVIVREQVSNTGSTGYLFCQPVVSDNRGIAFRLDERMGAGFSLIRKEGATPLNEDSLTVLKKLGINQVSMEGLTVDQGRIDPLFERGSVALVRPDRYVFGHDDNDLNPDALIASLAAKLHLR